MNRSRLLLFILLIVLCGVVVWSYLTYPRQATVSTLRYAPGKSVPVGAATAPVSRPVARAVTKDPAELRLDLLEHRQTSFSGYRRNIFSPIFAEKKVVVKPPPPPPSPPPPPPPVEVPPPKPPLAKFTFLGFLSKENHKTVFLANEREIHLVKQNDVFARRYQAVSLSDVALTIRTTDTAEEIVIPLTEGSPLR